MGISTDIQLTTTGRVFPQMLINNCIFSHPFHIVENNFNVNNDGILGSDFLIKYGATIDYSTHSMQIHLPSTEIPFVKDPMGQNILPRRNEESQEMVNGTSNNTDTKEDTQDETCKIQKDLDNDNCKINLGKSINDTVKIQSKNRNYYEGINDNFKTIKSLTMIELPPNEEKENAINYLLNEIYDQNVCFTDKITSRILNTATIEMDNRAKHIFESLNVAHCSNEEKREMEKLCMNFVTAFFVEGDSLKHTNVIKHKIDLKPGTLPINTRQYRIPELQKNEIQKQLDELEKRGIIEKSNSPWNSPLLLVPKKENQYGEKQYRLVIDYRKLNTVTQPLSYPIPLIDEIIDQMQGAQIFTTLDLQGAFHQIPMHPDSKEYTAFSTSWDKYHFNSMPFGLVGSPYTWLRAIHTVLKGIIGFGVYVYMDDIIIYSKTLREHTKILEDVLKRLIRHNLKLKIEKSIFFHSQVSYLGHIFSKNGIKVDPKKTSCMANFPRPNSVVEVQRFLGMCNYYRRYLQNYARIAKPLYILCKKDIPFIWNPGCEESFNNLKKALSSPPLLIFPNFNETFIVTTDASDFAVGAVISQGNMPYDKPIHYFSKTLSETQSRYSTIEKELLAIIWAIENFRHYLYGRQFLIVTDHKPLTFLLSTKNINSR